MVRLNIERTQIVRDSDVTTLTCLYGNMLNSASPELWCGAEHWYSDANRFCGWLARRYNRSVVEVAAIMAVYSMRTSWRENKARTVLYLATGEHKGTMLQFSKIFDIEAVGSDVKRIMEILRGPKISRFFHNILFWRTSPFATVDSWIIQPLGITQGELAGKYGTGEALYTRIEKAIRTVARMLQRPVAVVQAAIWGILRGDFR